MQVSELSVPARRAIFEAMVAMAWADSRLEREEILAIRAAGRVLELPDDALDALDAGPPDVAEITGAQLDPSDKKLVYLCAAWLSSVDAREADDESSLLAELRAGLGLERSVAEGLRDDARMLHVTTPATMPWWEELESLIARVSRTQAG